MNYQAWQGVVGGAAGVAAMSMLMRMALGMGMTRMEMPLILGSMLRRRRAEARPLGMMAHLVNGLLFGLAYAAVWYGIGVGSQAWSTASGSAPPSAPCTESSRRWRCR